jgi:hypothetical protein
MSKNITLVSIYHRHKLLDLKYIDFENVNFNEMTEERTKRGTFIMDYEGNRELANCSLHPALLR